MHEKLPDLGTLEPTVSVVEDKMAAGSRHDIRARRSMYRLLGSPPLTEETIERYERQNRAFDESLPKLIQNFLDTEPIIRWHHAIPLINETSPSIQAEFYKQIETKVRAEIINLGPNNRAASTLIPYVSPEVIAELLTAIFTQPSGLLGRESATYIKLAPPDQQARIIELAWGIPAARVRILQGITALPEEQRSKIVMRGLRDHDPAVTFLAVQKIEYLAPTDQPEARALVSTEVELGLQHESPHVFAAAAGMIKYAAQEAQPALREQLYKVMLSKLSVPPASTSQLGFGRDWLSSPWDVPSVSIADRLIIARLIDEAPLGKQDELRSLVPPIIREGLAKNQPNDHQSAAIVAIGYAPAELRSAFIQAVLRVRPYNQRCQATYQIRNAPEHERCHLFKRAFADSNDFVRMIAIDQLQFIPESERVPLIIQALTDPNKKIREKMMDVAIYCIPEQALQTVIEAGMDSPYPDVVDYSAMRLWRLPNEVAAKIHQRHPQHFKGPVSVASHSPLYNAAEGERFRIKPFAKTGSGLDLLDKFPGASAGESMRENVIIRTIPLRSFLPWRKAFEASEIWKNNGFDYVPIEPIVRTLANKRVEDIRVATRVINGPSIVTWLRQSAMHAIEIISVAEKIIEVLQTLGIEHGHGHYNNFVLLFDRDEHGAPIITTPPRVYLIDFDQAVMRVPDV